MENIKKYFGIIVGLVVAILTGAFLYERSRRKSAEAIADNQDMIDELNKGNKVLTKNEGLLEAEEVKRNEIAKEADDRKSDTSESLADFLKKRQ